jgi:hypothetical protein
MSSRLDELRERRLGLVARSDDDRNALAGTFGGVEKQFHVVDMLVSVVQRVNRHRAILGLVAGGLILTPVVTKRWVRRASWLLPLAIAVFREMRSTRESRRRDEREDIASSAD